MIPDKTLAEVRHPHMRRRAHVIEQRDDYRALHRQWVSLIESMRAAPPDVRFRFAHQCVIDGYAELLDVRGAAIHGMAFDHSYEEIAALVGLSRQRLQDVHHRWLEVSGTENWGKTGRWSRMWERRRREKADLEN